eukprot:g2135.t1
MREAHTGESGTQKRALAIEKEIYGKDGTMEKREKSSKDKFRKAIEWASRNARQGATVDTLYPELMAPRDWEAHGLKKATLEVPELGARPVKAELANEVAAERRVGLLGECTVEKGQYAQMWLVPDQALDECWALARERAFCVRELLEEEGKELIDLCRIHKYLRTQYQSTLHGSRNSRSEDLDLSTNLVAQGYDDRGGQRSDLLGKLRRLSSQVGDQIRVREAHRHRLRYLLKTRYEVPITGKDLPWDVRRELMMTSDDTIQKLWRREMEFEEEELQRQEECRRKQKEARRDDFMGAAAAGVNGNGYHAGPWYDEDSTGALMNREELGRLLHVDEQAALPKNFHATELLTDSMTPSMRKRFLPAGYVADRTDTFEQPLAGRPEVSKGGHLHNGHYGRSGLALGAGQPLDFSRFPNFVVERRNLLEKTVGPMSVFKQRDRETQDGFSIGFQDRFMEVAACSLIGATVLMPRLGDPPESYTDIRSPLECGVRFEIPDKYRRGPHIHSDKEKKAKIKAGLCFQMSRHPDVWLQSTAYDVLWLQDPRDRDFLLKCINDQMMFSKDVLWGQHRYADYYANAGVRGPGGGGGFATLVCSTALRRYDGLEKERQLRQRKGAGMRKSREGMAVQKEKKQKKMERKIASMGCDLHALKKSAHQRAFVTGRCAAMREARRMGRKHMHKLKHAAQDGQARFRGIFQREEDNMRAREKDSVWERTASAVRPHHTLKWIAAGSIVTGFGPLDNWGACWSLTEMEHRNSKFPATVFLRLPPLEAQRRYWGKFAACAEDPGLVSAARLSAPRGNRGELLNELERQNAHLIQESLLAASSQRGRAGAADRDGDLLHKIVIQRTTEDAFDQRHKYKAAETIEVGTENPYTTFCPDGRLGLARFVANPAAAECKENRRAAVDRESRREILQTQFCSWGASPVVTCTNEKLFADSVFRELEDRVRGMEDEVGHQSESQCGLDRN